MKKRRWFKKSVVWFCLVAILCSSALGASVYADDGTTVDATSGTLTTPFGAEVPIKWINSEPTPSQLTMSSYPSAIKLEDADYTYNCFTYAIIHNGDTEYIDYLTESQKFCIDNPRAYVVKGDPRQGDNPCLNNVNFANAQAGDLVLYKIVYGDGNGEEPHYTHAAIISEKGNTIDETYVISKWGYGDVYSHKIKECPYCSTGPDGTVTYGGIPSLPRNYELSFFRVQHDYNIFTAIVIPPPRPTMTARSLWHLAKCGDCGAFHVELHNYQSTTCVDCGYFTGTSINSTENVVAK